MLSGGWHWLWQEILIFIYSFSDINSYVSGVMKHETDGQHLGQSDS